MNKLLALWVKIDGYKTYIVCAATLVYAVGYYGIGQNDWATAVSMALGASGLGALRHSQEKL